MKTVFYLILLYFEVLYYGPAISWSEEQNRPVFRLSMPKGSGVNTQPSSCRRLCLNSCERSWHWAQPFCLIRITHFLSNLFTSDFMICKKKRRKKLEKWNRKNQLQFRAQDCLRYAFVTSSTEIRENFKNKLLIHELHMLLRLFFQSFINTSKIKRTHKNALNHYNAQHRNI